MGYKGCIHHPGILSQGVLNGVFYFFLPTSTVETVSVGLNSETLEAITSEAEIRDFDSRSAYLRHIIQNRGQIESLDQTEVEVVEEVAAQLKEHHHEKISEIEDRLLEFDRAIESVHEVAGRAQRRFEYLEKTQERISEIESTTNSNEDKLSDYGRKTRSNQRDIRSNQEEIESLKDQIRALKSDIRDIRESNSNSS